MDTHELSSALRAATGTIDTPPGFTERVRQGARRRVVRRRYRICAVVLAVLAIGGGLTALSAHLTPEVASTHPTTGANTSSSLPSDDPRLHEPTRGDFANNQSFLTQVVAVWRNSPHLPVGGQQASPIGSATVYWAGSTADGPAAVLLQTFSSQPTGNSRPPTTVVRIGVVADATKSDTLTLEDEQTVGDPGGSSESFVFGADNTTMLTLAESGFHVYSPAPLVDSRTGKVRRQWGNLPYIDGVAVVDLSPAQGNGRTVVELPQLPDTGHPYLPPEGSSVRSPYQPVSGGYWDGPADPRLPWPLETVVCAPPSGVNTTDEPQWGMVFDNALRDGGYSDRYVVTPPSARGASDSTSNWHIGCWLASGNMLILGEELVGEFDRLYAVTADRDGRVISVAYGGPIDPNDALPVRYELPDGSGWLVAAYGSQLISGNVSGANVLPVPPGAASVTVMSRGEAITLAP